MRARPAPENAPGRWPPNRLREARQARGLSQAALGFRVGYDGSTVHRFENGSRELTWAAAERLARELGVDPGGLFIPPRERPPSGPAAAERLAVARVLAERLAALPARERNACLRLARALAADRARPGADASS